MTKGKKMKQATCTNKKYEIIEDDFISVGGETVYRIRALKSFGNVKHGDLGGYVASYRNLDHLGDAWVFGDAQVFGDARVFGDAWVYNQKSIITVLDIGSERGCLTIHKDDKISVRVNRGCFTEGISEFLEAVESTHGDNVHGKIYKALIDVAKIKFELD